MRSGRPAYHIKAHYVSFFDINNHSMIYFELDGKGNLKKNEKGQFSSHFENVYAANNQLINKPKENPIVPNTDIANTDKAASIQEIDKNIEESPPRIEVNDNMFGSFDDDFDIFNSFAINDTDYLFPDDNLLGFSEDQTLDII